MAESETELSTSFGAATSRFDSWPLSKKKKTICRFSVGYEENENLILHTFSEIFNKEMQNEKYGNFYDICEKCETLQKINECSECYNIYFNNCAIDEKCPCQRSHEEICSRNVRCSGCGNSGCNDCLESVCCDCNAKMCKDCKGDEDALCDCHMGIDK